MKRSYSKYWKGLLFGSLFCISFACVVVVATIINNTNKNNNNDNNAEQNETEVVNSEAVSAVVNENKSKETERLLNDIVDITIGEYREVEEGGNFYKGIIVKAKNKSDQDTPLGVQIAAMDGNDEISDVASIYTDTIHADETQEFLMFTDSRLTADELKESKFKVYNLYTVEAEEPEGYEAVNPFEDRKVLEAQPKEQDMSEGENATE